MKVLLTALVIEEGDKMTDEGDRKCQRGEEKVPLNNGAAKEGLGVANMEGTLREEIIGGRRRERNGRRRRIRYGRKKSNLERKEY